MLANETTTRVRLTKTAVEGLPPSQRPYWDADLTGYAVLVSERGTRTFFVQKRLPDGKQIKATIGRHGVWTPEKARARAKVLLGQIAAGIDPTAERRVARRAERQRLDAPTVKELLDRYMEEHAKRRKRSRSVETDQSLINKHLEPKLGSEKVADVTSGMVERMHGEISAKTPIAANRALALLSKAMSMAIKWEMRADNPCRGIERNPEERRERHLTSAELGRLCKALNKRHKDLTAAAIAFLLLTGARRGETLAARWRDFDRAAGTWTKPSSHTKQKRSHRVPLSASASGVLDQLSEPFAPGEPPANGYVFGPDLIDRVRRTWKAVRDEAELPGLRLHDLRHAYASMLASRGLSLPIIGALLGHSTPVTTARYAHLLDDPLRQATEHVGSLWTALSDRGGG